ncbi:MAG TPA: AmmeMemoRadiSam system protein B, partial [bacterium]|nr:AmmeMemoRadiSam system protein B [bacterium]
MNTFRWFGLALLSLVRKVIAMDRQWMLMLILSVGSTLVLLFFSKVFAACAWGDQTTTKERIEVRPCSGKGFWFPESETELRSEVQEHIRMAQQKKMPGKIIGLVAPHAGYSCSGSVAGKAYRQIHGNPYDVVVIIGLSHRYPISKASVQPVDFYETPLGRIPIDKHSAMALLEFSNEFEYVKGAHAEEHSVENQIPFLQEAVPNLKIVPIVINKDSLAFTERVADDLALVFKGKNVLFVCSTDMSHFPNYDDANRVDRAALEALKCFDLPLVDRKISELERQQVPMLDCVFCGKAALYTVMGAAKRLGADSVEIIEYQNSGDILGSKSRVVGYGAVALCQKSKGDSNEIEQAQETSQPESMDRTIVTESIGLSPEEALLNDQQKSQLLNIAKKTVTAVANGEEMGEVTSDDPALMQPRGAFVTLKKSGRLRGCIGSLEARRPLAVDVRAN